MNESVLMVVLRLIHIIGGIFWVGTAFLVAWFLMPTQKATGMAGLTFVGWGCTVGLGYSLSRLAYAVLDPVLPGRPPLLLTVGRWSALISLAALAVGVLTPWWLPSALAWRDARCGTAEVAESWMPGEC